MRHLTIALIGSLFAATAVSAAALDRDEARHLLLRTGYSPTPAEIDVLLPLSREQAVDQLLASIRMVARTDAPAWAKDSAARCASRACTTLVGNRSWATRAPSTVMTW